MAKAVWPANSPCEANGVTEEDRREVSGRKTYHLFPLAGGQALTVSLGQSASPVFADSAPRGMVRELCLRMGGPPPIAPPD